MDYFKQSITGCKTYTEINHGDKTYTLTLMPEYVYISAKHQTPEMLESGVAVNLTSVALPRKVFDTLIGAING